MELCVCSYPKTVDVMGSWDGCPLEGGAHTAFMVSRCRGCGKIGGFPEENFKLALERGSATTKETLAKIMGPKVITKGGEEDMEGQKIKVSIKQYGAIPFSKLVPVVEEHKLIIVTVPAGGLRGYPEPFEILIEPVGPEAEDPETGDCHVVV